MKKLTPKLALCVAIFTLALVVTLAALTWQRPSHSVAQPDYSVTHWAKIARYPGEVCIHPYIQANGRPVCANGVQYTKSSANAGEAYALWLGCHKYNDPEACQILKD